MADNIPSIITTDLDDNDDTASNSPNSPKLSPTNPGPLSPSNAQPQRASLDNDSASFQSHDSTVVPPSPTHSTRSSLYSSVALCNNNGDPTTDFFPPKPKKRGHTFASISEGTEPDTSPLNVVVSRSTAVETRSDSREDPSDKKDKQVVRGALENKDIDLGPFEQKPVKLASLLDPKSLGALEEMGGVQSILSGLNTDAKKGLPVEKKSTGDSHEKPDIESGGNNEKTPSYADRRRVYGANILPVRLSKSIWSLMWAALQESDRISISLCTTAAISLVLGLAQNFGLLKDPDDIGPLLNWVEGVAIVVAVMSVVIVGSVNDYLLMLNNKKEERVVRVMRGGVKSVVDIKEIVVGDICLLEAGEIIPVDGIFLTGHNVKCDESGATGQSDAIKKVPYKKCIVLRNRAKAEGSTDGHPLDTASSHTDCFMVSGSKVLEGVGSYVVVAVGTKSFNGRMMMALRGDSEETPLQPKHNALAQLIATIGSICGLIPFSRRAAALMILLFQFGNKNPVRTPSESHISYFDIFIISVTLVVVGDPQGPSSGSGLLRNRAPSLIDIREVAPSTVTFTIKSSDQNGYRVLKKARKILDDTGILFSPPNDNQGKTKHPVDLVPVLANSATAREQVRELRGVDAQHAMNALYAALMTTAEDTTLQNQIVRLLTDLSVQSGGMLPAELMIVGVTMTEYERQHGFAKGGFADVHKGSYNGRVVSIKVSKIMANDSKKTRVEFCREALLWQTLKHKNILPFLGTSVAVFPSRVLCLIAPYMEDMTIIKYLQEDDEQNKSVSDFNIYIFLCQIVDGMAYLHQRGVIHGDLKCENILVNKEKIEAYLIDFGITSYAEPGTLPQVKVGGGTYPWASPEIIKATSDPERDIVSKSENGNENEEIAKIRRMSDVYSLSMTIIQLFTRRTPWHNELPRHLVSDDDKREAIRANILADKRPQKGAEAVPTLLQALLRDCWHNDYKLRPEMVKIQEHLIALNPQPEPQLQL